MLILSNSSCGLFHIGDFAMMDWPKSGCELLLLREFGRMGTRNLEKRTQLLVSR